MIHIIVFNSWEYFDRLLNIKQAKLFNLAIYIMCFYSINTWCWLLLHFFKVIQDIISSYPPVKVAWSVPVQHVLYMHLVILSSLATQCSVVCVESAQQVLCKNATWHFPRVFYQMATIPKCSIFQAATSQDCPNRSARPQPVLVAAFGSKPILATVLGP